MAFLKQALFARRAVLSKFAEEEDREGTPTRLMEVASLFLAGGKANRTGLTVDKVDPRELEMGIAVEYEHTPDKMTAQRIALDHLAEIPDYYTRLKKMEDEAKAEEKSASFEAEQTFVSRLFERPAT